MRGRKSPGSKTPSRRICGRSVPALPRPAPRPNGSAFAPAPSRLPRPRPSAQHRSTLTDAVASLTAAVNAAEAAFLRAESLAERIRQIRRRFFQDTICNAPPARFPRPYGFRWLKTSRPAWRASASFWRSGRALRGIPASC